MARTATIVMVLSFTPLTFQFALIIRCTFLSENASFDGLANGTLLKRNPVWRAWIACSHVLV